MTISFYHSLSVSEVAGELASADGDDIVEFLEILSEKLNEYGKTGLQELATHLEDYGQDHLTATAMAALGVTLVNHLANLNQRNLK